MAEKDSKQQKPGKKFQKDETAGSRGREESASERNRTLHPPGPRSMGNAGQWLEYQLTELRKDYGKLVSDMTAENKYVRPKPPAVDMATLTEEKDPLGIQKALVIKEHSNYARKLEEDEEKYSQMYSKLWSTMSTASQQLIKAESTFSEAEKECDPHKLIALVKTTHLCVDNYSEPVIKQGSLLNFYYTQLKQFRNESLSAFRIRFELVIKSFKDAGVEAMQPNNAQAAWDFIKRLNNEKYPGIAEDVEYNINMNVFKAPVDLDEAVEYVNKWDRSNVMYAQRTRQQQHANASMFHTGAKGGRGRGHGGRGGQQRNASDEKSGNDNAGGNKKLTAKEKANKLKNIECFNCHEKGHYSSKCPQKKKKQEDDEDSTAKNYVTLVHTDEATGHVDYDANMFVTCATVMPAMKSKRCGEKEILLDNESQASVVFNKKLLTNIRKSNITLHVFGAVGKGYLKTNTVGDLKGFGPIHYHPNVNANILCFSKVRKTCYIEYDNDRNIFVVTTPDQSRFNFVDRDCLYTCIIGVDDQHDETSAQVNVTTVDDNEKRFPKHLVKRAREARRLSAALGHESDGTLWKILHNGAYTDMNITPDDIRRAREIYGPSIPVLKGTATHKKPAYTKIPYQIEYNATRNQTLHIDIMFVETEPFLLSVSKPLSLTICRELAAKKTRFVREALINAIDIYKMHDYKIVKVSFDNEAVLHAATSNIEGITLSPRGSGLHEKVAESKARRIKERMRAILNSLPYELPIKLLKWLIGFVVMRKNSIPVDGSGTRFSPRELFTGTRSNAKTELRIGFGDYVQTSEPYTDNSLKMRTRGAIALYPTGNDEGSVKFFDLATQSIITRTSWTKVPMPHEVIEYINSLSDGEGKRLPKNPVMKVGEAVIEDVDTAEQNIGEPSDQGRIPKVNPMYRDKKISQNELMSGYSLEQDEPALNTTPKIQESPVVTDDGTLSTDIVSDTLQKEETDDIVEDSDSIPPDGEGEEQHDDNSECAPQQKSVGRRGTVPVNYKALSGIRSRPKKQLPSKSEIKSELKSLLLKAREEATEFLFNMTVQEGVAKHGELAEQSIKKELLGILSKDTILPVKLSKRELIKLKGRLIPSKMFLKEKFLANGDFDRLKSRLVGGGHRQDRNLYRDTSSPTPRINSIFTIAAIAAKENRRVRVIDIGNAYLNASMEGDPVYMIIKRDIAKYLIEIDPTFEEFKDDNHEIVVKLKKALYGCVQSSKLWYKHIKGTLEQYGFKMNEADECVFNIVDSKVQCTVVVYVDDLLITCVDEDMIARVQEYLIKTYVNVKCEEGEFHSYLGMNLDFRTRGQVSISMKGYIEEMMSDYGISKVARTPANNNLFVDILPEVLSEEYQKKLHSITARLLYIGTRVRPEILLVVNYLATRVNKYSQGDWQKAMRCMEYLNGDTELGLTLSIGNNMNVNLFADASYGVHADGKSHSASVIKVGNSTVAARSSKQKIVTKSTTEAELVCASDMLSSAIWEKDFLTEQGYRDILIILHQDNLSTIKLAETGKSTSEKTRHVKVRYFFMKEKIDTGELKVCHTGTKDMIADILTKPLQGELFQRLRSALLGHDVEK